MPVDETKTVAELCRQHRHQIDALILRNKEAWALDETQFKDDLFALRFLLSHKLDLDKASDAFVATCKWRHENRDELRRLAAGGAVPYADEVERYSINGFHKQTTDGWPLFIVRAGLSNVRRLMDDVPTEHVQAYFKYNKEAAYVLCDRETRRRGKLVKFVSVIDFKHVSFSNNDNRFFKVMGDSSKETEVFYPQLLGISVMINMPIWFRAMLAVAKLFMSRQTLEKTKFCYGKTLKEPISACPYARSVLRDEDIPSFLGGTCQCAGGCIGRVPNARDRMVMQEGEEDERTHAQRLAKEEEETSPTAETSGGGGAASARAAGKPHYEEELVAAE